MNEQIRKLAEQSGAVTGTKLTNVTDALVLIGEEEIQAFAKLIVKECAATLTAESERLYKLASEEKNEVFASNFEICAEKCRDNEAMIKQHFGVE